MTRLIRIFLLSTAVCLVSLFSAVPALAVPTLPSSFYGTVKVNDANVADGTRVQALINGHAYAEGLTQTYQGDSVYTVDVPGDDTGTAAQDGGREGDTIQFKIGGALSNQTGTWHSGTNVMLNLTVSTSATLPAPKASPRPIPTQTAITIAVRPSFTPTIEAELTEASTATVQSLPTKRAVPPSSLPAEPVQPQPTSGLAPNSEQNGSRSPGRTIGVIVLILVVAAGGFWYTRRKI
jgi:hypothetical protein